MTHLYLHSTIFILKLEELEENKNILYKFTFYNIYIKTIQLIQMKLLLVHLHSTIFILKPNIRLAVQQKLTHLHSTIFILKLYIINIYFTIF